MSTEITPEVIAQWVAAIPTDMKYAESLRTACRAGVLTESDMESRIAQHYTEALGLDEEAARRVALYAFTEACKRPNTVPVTPTPPAATDMAVRPTVTMATATATGPTEPQRLVSAIRVAVLLTRNGKGISRRQIREQSKAFAHMDAQICALTQDESGRAMETLASVGAATTYRKGRQNHEYFEMNLSHELFATHAADLVASIPEPEEPATDMSTVVW